MKKVMVVIGAGAAVAALAAMSVLKAEVDGPGQDGVISIPVQDAEREQNAKSVATAWFQALMAGDVPTTMALSDLPFALDRKRIIRDSRELKAVYDQVAAEKGKRELQPTEVTVPANRSEIIQGCIPVDALVVLIRIEDEVVAICVRPGDEYRVVGFSD